jgi:hypothetical protein
MLNKFFVRQKEVLVCRWRCYGSSRHLAVGANNGMDLELMAISSGSQVRYPISPPHEPTMEPSDPPTCQKLENTLLMML